jgi:hypothetical protein
MDKRKIPSSLLISKVLVKEKAIGKPNYKYWLAKTKLTVLEISCLLNGIDVTDFHDLVFMIEEHPCSPNDKTYEHGFIEACKTLAEDVSYKSNAMLTWLPGYSYSKTIESRADSSTRVEADPLNLINRYIIAFGSIPKELLVIAKKSFLLLYQSRDANEYTKKNWADNWHTLAPPFKALIDKSTKTKKEKEISPRKEETLSILIWILSEMYFTGNKYKKPDGSLKTSTMAEFMIDHISKQLPDGYALYGFKKSNLIETFNSSRDCWRKKKEF